MNRNIYEQIATMRSGMDIWVSYSEEIVAGASVENKHKPVTPARCEFWQRYNSLGPLLKDLQAYKRIKTHHENMHILYRRIYDLICPNDACSIRCPSDDCSALAKLSGKAATLRERRRNEAKELLSTFRMLNQQLIDMIDLLEEEIRKVYKTPAERLAEVSAKSDHLRKQEKVNYMLSSLDLSVN